MRYTPVELRHVHPPRRLLGYKRSEVEHVLEDVADSFEEVWRERGELADKLEDAEKRLDEVRQRESLLASTLLAAEKTAAEAIENAKREAEIIVAEAHQESRSITRTAQNERERLFAESRRVETLLRAALGMVEESHHEAVPGSAAASESWPNRQDTREFEAISLEEVEARVQAGSDADEQAEAEPEPPRPEGAKPDNLPAPLPPLVEPEHGFDDDEPPKRDFSWE
ncbi:MAG TPA: DivIVA domain-containing protein [Gaiellaceae bacterium]|nr:DivIVA domain-containing protein [Gaiellaceae bacterium]